MELYRGDSEGVRPRFSEGPARLAYRRYVDFVDLHAPRRARILDIGCGGGWTTFLLGERGHDVRGLDLHDGALDVDVPYTKGDATALPFPDASFDVVAMYQTLEHVAEPERALEEARRVLQPGGRLIVVGPNLLSLPLAVRGIALNRRSWRRTADLPRHPFGNTVPETLATIPHRALHTARGLLGRGPRFLPREPDPRPPFHADNDAAWLCNPMDVRSWGPAAGMLPVRWWSDRPAARLLWPFAAGTWIVLERLPKAH
jgi:SAM-dependent methyltransferase